MLKPRMQPWKGWKSWKKTSLICQKNCKTQRMKPCPRLWNLKSSSCRGTRSWMLFEKSTKMQIPRFTR
ncbi:formin like 2 [Phyllostomus discolor]|uniref:Formin like 2 n=1 Tax=Phyllostomus discolor TaxID=89673 RepID=A0A834AN43_9CHIR|nr:formin like 2 [Phyllostomus discolor]